MEHNQLGRALADRSNELKHWTSLIQWAVQSLVGAIENAHVSLIEAIDRNTDAVLGQVGDQDDGEDQGYRSLSDV